MITPRPWDDFCRFAGGGPSAARASRWRVTVSSLAEATRNQKQPSALELLQREWETSHYTASPPAARPLNSSSASCASGLEEASATKSRRATSINGE